MINRKEHDHNVDIWALGVIMFEVLTGYLPFNAVNKETLEESIKKVKINWPNDIDRAAKDLIGKILRYDPKHRISIENMFSHPFLTSVLPNPMDFLIKPNQEKDLDIYIISVDTPSSEKEKEKVKNQNQAVANESTNKPISNIDNNEETKLLKTMVNEYCLN